MDPILALVIGAIGGLLIGALVTALIIKSRNKLPEQLRETQYRLQETELRLETALKNYEEIQEEVSGLDDALERFREQLLDAEKSASAFESRSVALAEQVKQMDTQHKEWRAKEQQDNSVLKALSPVQETLRTMQQKVTELETQRAEQYGEIKSQLIETRDSGEKIRSTAESLASALRSNSTRGVWGEVQLKNIVEASGMIDHVDFETQVSTIGGQGENQRPDMVINLPGGKTIAVDAKVPFNKYLEAHEIPETAPQSELDRKAALMKEHARALKAHIDALAKKEYWTGQENSPEFTVAFIPSESLIAAALEADKALMDYAFRKKVALSSPVTLWSVLKTVAYSWSQDTITREAKQLLDMGKLLYDRLNTLGGHVNKLKRSIDGTVNSFNSFAGSLEGRVFVSARNLKWLDESTVLPELQQVTEDTRVLTSPELTAEAPELNATEAAAEEISETEN